MYLRMGKPEGEGARLPFVGSDVLKALMVEKAAMERPRTEIPWVSRLAYGCRVLRIIGVKTWKGDGYGSRKARHSTSVVHEV